MELPLRELNKLNNLQKQLKDTKEALANKVAKAASESLLPAKSVSTNEISHPFQSQQKMHAKQISANESSHQTLQQRPAKHAQSAAAFENSHQSAG
jgi:hypothetical protein